ncbi:MAG: hypothetical protein N2439_09880, partial [Anaerolineae bacterium]|nr:hypothetical protein [Anaerolineae bacterium]
MDKKQPIASRRAGAAPDSTTPVSAAETRLASAMAPLPRALLGIGIACSLAACAAPYQGQVREIYQIDPLIIHSGSLYSQRAQRDLAVCRRSNRDFDSAWGKEGEPGAQSSGNAVAREDIAKNSADGAPVCPIDLDSYVLRQYRTSDRS